ncbi:hypothetical protein [Mycolicibacterium lutetiense]|uniref:Uncharacterized protein n=1 Tax=Mycolicibacterium lutetiense TaxID=1641992 RepID=A0ABS4ZZ18_9MYCO|nr:hypothetical protein [Mycolicibacterium lutetiense]MBP2454759.1 hypothetical protein [Mycolicibacterium lutetiense]
MVDECLAVGAEVAFGPFDEQRDDGAENGGVLHLDPRRRSGVRTVGRGREATHRTDGAADNMTQAQVGDGLYQEDSADGLDIP